MATSPLSKVVEHLRRGALLQGGGDLSDGQLLDCFINNKEEAAFAALVRRHGAMVWGVCRRLLGSHHDAEDAFQATFLVLVRKAASVVPRQMVANWLYGVAYQTARKARTTIAKRRLRERQEDPMPEPAVEQDPWHDLQPVLDQELSRLPDKYRMPVILCDLEGKSYKEAARQLGWPEGTLSVRLSRARAQLATRLARRGLTLSAASLATLLAQNLASASVPAALVSNTIKAVTLVAAGNGAAAAISANAAALVEGVVKTMLLSKLKCIPVVLLAISGLAFGVGALHFAVATEEPGGNVPAESAAYHAAPRRNVGQAAQPQKTDAERLLGSWRISKARANGHDQPAEATALTRVKFSKDQKMFITAADEEPMERKYKLPAPGQLDIELPKIGYLLAIYKFEGDDHLVCCISNDQKKRPADFSPDKDSSFVLWVMDRAKPGQEKPTAEEIAKHKVFEEIREAQARMSSVNNLRHLGMAFLLLHDQTAKLPAHAIYSKDGKTPLLSWRVAILPYIDEQVLYEQFKLDEPWDSPNNKKLIDKMPSIFVLPGVAETKAGLTHYQVFTGPETVFDGPKKMKLVDVKDGISNTIMAVEAKESVIWTKPADLTLPKENDKLPPVGGIFKNGFYGLMCDGSVRLFPPNIEPRLFRALVTPNGGEPIDKN